MDKIINGQQVQGDFPYVVKIFGSGTGTDYDGSDLATSYYSGTLIAPNAVLTHDYYTRVVAEFVLLGCDDISSSRCITVGVKERIFEDEYNSAQVLILEENIQIETPQLLFDSSEDFEAGLKATVVSWGSNEEIYDDTSDIGGELKLSTEVYITESKSCVKEFSFKEYFNSGGSFLIPDEYICGEPIDDTSYLCEKDRGAPIILTCNSGFDLVAGVFHPTDREPCYQEIPRLFHKHVSRRVLTFLRTVIDKYDLDVKELSSLREFCPSEELEKNPNPPTPYRLLARFGRRIVKVDIMMVSFVIVSVVKSIQIANLQTK